MRKLTFRGLLRRIQEQLIELRKLDVREEKEIARLKIEKARAIGYLVSTASQVMEKHEVLKRIEELERRLEELEETKKP